MLSVQQTPPLGAEEMERGPGGKGQLITVTVAGKDWSAFWANLKNHYSEVRGIQPSKYYGVRGVPATTVGDIEDIIRRMDTPNGAFIVALQGVSPDGVPIIGLCTKDWAEMESQIHTADLITQTTAPYVVYPFNDDFWRALQKLHICIDSTSTVPHPWTLVKEAVSETIGERWRWVKKYAKYGLIGLGVLGTTYVVVKVWKD